MPDIEDIQFMFHISFWLSLNGHIICNNLWPPDFPDLTPCDFYLGGNLKKLRCIKQIPHTLEELINNICETATISREELQRVNNKLCQNTECI
jgi:hypothetical protein